MDSSVPITVISVSCENIIEDEVTSANKVCINLLNFIFTPVNILEYCIAKKRQLIIQWFRLFSGYIITECRRGCIVTDSVATLAIEPSAKIQLQKRHSDLYPNNREGY